MPCVLLQDLTQHLPIITIYSISIDHFLLLISIFATFLSKISDVMMYQDGCILDQAPADVELSPLDPEGSQRTIGPARFKNVAEGVKPATCRLMMRRGITMDSGAGDNVVPKRMVNAAKIRESPGQRRGLHYVAASSHRIPNLGEVDLDFCTLEGHSESWVCQSRT